MQKSLITILVAVLMAPTLSFAEKGDIVVRARVTHIAPDESSHLDSSVGDKLEVDSNTIPEIDFSYYFTKNIAAELILAVGSRHDVNIGGSGANAGAKLGSINLLPPTLTAQWHFNPDQTIDPVVTLNDADYEIFTPKKELRPEIRDQVQKTGRLKAFGEIGTYRDRWQFILHDKNWILSQ